MNGARAIAACRAYDYWAREIARLTSEIGRIACPREQWDLYADEHAPPSVESHFRASRRAVGARLPDLSQIAKRVADCPECSRLCVLIAERRAARKKWGAAKRAVRYAGRNPSTEGEGDES